MTEPPPDLGVVVVSYRTRELALTCVRSVLADAEARGPAVHVVAVDNASGDGTAEALLDEFGGLDSVTVVANAANAGFGAACDHGAELAVCHGVRHLLFLNADTRVLPGALRALTDELDTGGDVIVGPLLENPDGSHQPSQRGDPTPRALLYQHTAWRFLRLGQAAYRRYKAPDDDAVGVLMGAALATSRALYERLGGFDARYVLYFEEADLCRRARAAGARLRVVPAARVQHGGGKSADSDPAAALHLYLESMFRYVERFHGRGRARLFRVLFKPAFLVRLCTDALRDGLTWLVRPRKRAAKGAELRLFRRFALRGLGRFLRA